ncbi:hypothetical protein BDV34DRAFT_157422 [Aspergillus parasiticus]|uniref:Uncharacterized protein n=1 Tax=Aspergillus parasiticus TaxID=5067 RepID=A0A5N6DB71_ASPPA|nr:hypothetical protein BDV34DRAFT_157422 [Aspergillus parasiticus]
MSSMERLDIETCRSLFRPIKALRSASFPSRRVCAPSWMEKLVYPVKKGLLRAAEIPGAKELGAHTADWTCDRAFRQSQRAVGLNSKRFCYAAMTSSKIFCKCCGPVALFCLLCTLPLVICFLQQGTLKAPLC